MECRLEPRQPPRHQAPFSFSHHPPCCQELPSPADTPALSQLPLHLLNGLFSLFPWSAGLPSSTVRPSVPCKTSMPAPSGPPRPAPASLASHIAARPQAPRWTESSPLDWFCLGCLPAFLHLTIGLSHVTWGRRSVSQASFIPISS